MSDAREQVNCSGWLSRHSPTTGDAGVLTFGKVFGIVNGIMQSVVLHLPRGITIEQVVTVVGVILGNQQTSKGVLDHVTCPMDASSRFFEAVESSYEEHACAIDD